MSTPDRTPWLALGLTVGAAAAGAALYAWSRRRPAPLDLADDLQLGRYVGGWYEIARMPTRHEAGCRDTTATYVMEEDGSLQIINRCHRDGEPDEVRGEAWLPDPAQPARLKVQFKWPFRGDYCILRVDDDYRWALVGTPDREGAWILSRTPSLPENVISRLLAELEGQGFDSWRLVRTPQEMAGSLIDRDEVGTASRNSFPASDPPGWTGSHL